MHNPIRPPFYGGKGVRIFRNVHNKMQLYVFRIGCRMVIGHFEFILSIPHLKWILRQSFFSSLRNHNYQRKVLNFKIDVKFIIEYQTILIHILAYILYEKKILSLIRNRTYSQALFLCPSTKETQVCTFETPYSLSGRQYMQLAQACKWDKYSQEKWK